MALGSADGALILASKLNYKFKLLALTPSLFNENEAKHPLGHKRFNIHDYGDKSCEFLFRFTKQEIYRLADGFQLPKTIITPNRSKYDYIEALCILLRRLAYPNRYGELEQLFFRTKPELSMIFTWMIDYLHLKYGHLVDSFNLSWMDKAFLLHVSQKVTDKGSPLENCVGFIDGTLRPICRPSQNQKQLYSGHKRVHGLKFQSVVLPNGIIAQMFGPVEGRRHDSFMLKSSGLLEKVEEKFVYDDGHRFCLYGDPAYPIRPQLISPFKGSNLDADQELFNKNMSSVRQCVEWEFGRIIRLFAFLDYKKNLKLYQQPVGKMYKVGALLTNLHNCLRGSQTSAYFNVPPPTLEDYLQNGQNALVNEDEV